MSCRVRPARGGAGWLDAARAIARWRPRAKAATPRASTQLPTRAGQPMGPSATSGSRSRTGVRPCRGSRVPADREAPRRRVSPRRRASLGCPPEAAPHQFASSALASTLGPSRGRGRGPDSAQTSPRMRRRARDVGPKKSRSVPLVSEVHAAKVAGLLQRPQRLIWSLAACTRAAQPRVTWPSSSLPDMRVRLRPRTVQIRLAH